MNKPTSAASADEAGKAWAEQPGILQECGEIAVTRLCAGLSDALINASEQLFTKGTAARISNEQRFWLEASDFARSRRQNMVDAFRKHFEQRFPLACQRKPALITGHVLNFDVRRLRIVEHEVLENGLDSEIIIEAIRNGSWTSLHELTKWFRVYLSDQELIPNEMPLGPKLIGSAVTDAISEQFGGYEIKQRLLRALGQNLPTLINRIYLDLVGHLANVRLESGNDAKDENALITLDLEVADSAIPEPETESPLVDAPAQAIPIDGGRKAALAVATAAASEVIDHRLAGKRLPSFIAEFLTGPWRSVLSGIHLEHGPTSPEWNDALQTMNDLVRSLRSKHTPEKRINMMGELPSLVKRLHRCLERLQQPIESNHRFFARLAEYHIRILGATRPAAATPAHPQAPMESRPPESISTESAMEALCVETWLEFRKPYPASRKLKIAWISPNRNLFLLTNHLGERALSLGPKDLAALLLEGGARIIPSPDATTARDVVALAPQAKKTA